MNLAARAARWSAQHRKAAILGWFGFVIVAVLAGTMVTQNKISDVDRFNGEAHRAEQALDRSGLRPTRRPSSFRAAISRSTIPSSGRRSRTRGPALQASIRGERRVAARGGGARYPDRHAALVNFEIAGDSTETADRVDPTLDRGRCRPGPASESAGRAVRRRQRQQGGQRDQSTTTSQRRGSCPCRSR